MAGQVLARFVYKLAADSAGFTKGVKQAGVALKGFATKSDRQFKAVDKSSQKSTKSQIDDLKKIERQRDKNEKEMNRRARRQKMRGTHSSQRPVVGVPMHRNPDPLRQPVSAAVRARGARSYRTGPRPLHSDPFGTGPRRSIRDRLSGSGGGGGDSQPPGFFKGLGQQAMAGASASFGKAAMSAKAMQVAFGAVGVALKGLKLAFIGGIKSAAEFEEQFQVVKAITTGTTAGFEELKTQIVEVGSTTEHSFSQLTKAAEVLGRAGFKAREVGKALATVSDLATAGGLSVAKAADLSVRMLKSFGMTMDKLPNVADMLAKASASANVSIQSLGEGFKFTGAIAKSAGLKFSDVTTALSLLGETGLEAGLAGRALQAMIMDLSKPTDDAKQALFEMGIVTHDVEGNMLSLSSILRQLKEAQVGNTEAFEIFNRNSARAATALVGVTDKYIDFQTSVENSTGAIREQSDVIRDSLNKQLKITKGIIEGMAVEVFGDEFEGGMAIALENFNSNLRKLAKKLFDVDIPGPRIELFEVDQHLSKPKGKTKEQKLAEENRKIEEKKLKDAAERARKLSSDRLISGDPIQGGEKGFIGAAERFTFAFQQTLVEGEGALASANLAGKVKTLFSNIFTELAKEAGIGAVAARKAAVAGQKEFMKSQAFLNAQRKQNVVLERIQDEEFLDELLKFDAKERQKVIEATKRRLDLQVQQNAKLTEKALALNEKAFKEVDNIHQRLPESFREKLEDFITKGVQFRGVRITDASTEDILAEGKDLEKQAGVDALIGDGAGIMEVFDAAMELKSGWTTAFFMAKKLALDFYDTVENSFLAVSGEIGGIFVNMVKGMAAGGPMMAIGSAMMSVLQKSEAFMGFMETAGEILGVLANALNPFVEVISSVMVPILKVVARILLASFTVLAVIWNAIAGFLNLFGANIQTIDIGEMWSSFEDGMDNLGNSVDDTTNKFDDLNTSLTGIAGLPDAIKLNLIAFREAMNSTRAILTGRTSASPGHMSGPIRMHTGGVVPGAGNQDTVHALLTPGEQVIPAGQSAGDGTNVQIGTMIVKVTDVKDFVKKLNNQQEWRSMARSGSLYGKGVVGSR